MTYIAGWNTPGYLPDADPVAFDDRQDAEDYVIEEVNRHLDTLYLLLSGRSFKEAVEAVNEEKEGGFTHLVLPTGSSEKHDLGVSFWVDTTEEGGAG